MNKSVIVIGAGWSGLAAAKTYLQINPTIDLMIIDNGDSVGGVWSKERVYPGLIVDSPAGLYEFSDLSFLDDKGRKRFARLTGQDVSAYFERYVQKHRLTPYLRLGTSIISISRHEASGPWRLLSSIGEYFTCTHLIISTGLASTPKWPNILSSSHNPFTGPTFHSQSLALDHHRLTYPSIKTVVVVGGCKSAIEAISLAVTAGKFVHWIIRPSPAGGNSSRSGGGTGPGLIINIDKSRPNLIALNLTRIFNTLSPSIFTTSGFWYNFFHSGKFRLGHKLNELYWKAASKVVLSGPGYGRSRNGELVRPEMDSVFWNPKCLSIVDSRGPFLEYLHDEGKLKIHRASVERLSGEGVHLDDGEILKADAVIYATGWHKSPSFFDLSTASSLGLPVPLSSEDPSTTSHWASLDTAATCQVHSLFPALRLPPPTLPNPSINPKRTPYRLYRHIIPPSLAVQNDRTIAFTGHLVTSQSVVFAELSALYAVAYMEHLLPRPLPSLQNMEEDVALVNAWMKSRYLRKGVEEPLNLNEQAFFDVLLGELGLNAKRKKGFKGLGGMDRWFWEWFAPYRPRDYEGIVEEFMEGCRKRGTLNEREAGALERADYCAHERTPLLGGTRPCVGESGSARDLERGKMEQRTRSAELTAHTGGGVVPICYRIRDAGKYWFGSGSSSGSNS